MNLQDGNTAFQTAVSFVNQTNQHIFLTGKAGTGKTTFLKYIRDHSFKKMAILAPTGVAAINAGGVTIHSFFNLPFGTFLPTMHAVWGGENTSFYNKNQLFQKAKLNTNKRDLIKSLDLLIIDEISMVRADMLDAINNLLQGVRRNNTPFGGVQMLFIGDMFQLPPVVKPDEWEKIQEYYESPFFFDAQVIKESSPVYIELKKIYRQSDDTFIRILNHVRNNECTEDDMMILNDYYKPYFVPYRDDKYITLTTHNSKADHINQLEMDRIPAQPVVFNATVKDNFPENAFPVEKSMQLKVGAQIMFIKNDKGENRRYFNGKIGIIDRIDAHDRKVFVRFPDEDEAFEMEKETWRNVRYQYDEDHDEVKEDELGSFTQYPIRLAWAVTIHKSQGLTFDKAIIDAGQAFAPGQVYVALSRMTGLEGMVLKSRITPASIQTDPRIIAFAASAASDDSIQSTLKLSRQLYVEDILKKAFDWDAPLGYLAAFAGSMLQRSIPQKEETMKLLEQVTTVNNQIYRVMLRFHQELNSLMDEGYPALSQLNERVNAAAGWVLRQTDTCMLEPLKKHLADMQLKGRTKKYAADLKVLIAKIERKLLLVSQAQIITEKMSEGEPLEKVMNQVTQMTLEKEKSHIDAPDGVAVRDKDRESTYDITFRLFKEGNNVAEIARLRGYARSTVISHLCRRIQTGEIPATSLMDINRLDVILKAMDTHPEMGTSELKNYLGDDTGYEDIRIAVAHQQFSKGSEKVS